jgi:uncharacterized damage-inducible protein DinB
MGNLPGRAGMGRTFRSDKKSGTSAALSASACTLQEEVEEITMARSAAMNPDFCQRMLEAYAISDRMNQMVLERVDPQAWRAQPPSGGARNIAAIFAHMHNIRRKWLRLSAPSFKLPPQLDRSRCTQKQAGAALKESARLCGEMLAQALHPAGAVKQFRRDGWARAWRPGPAMFAYMILHDAHHRGQICMLAHQLGYPIKSGYELWMWEKLSQQCGFHLLSR